MGYFRLLLATMVLAAHLGPPGYFFGTIAVFGFFTLSGFLITLVVNEEYGQSPKGKMLFLINRFFRIYPTYWVCLMISLLIVGGLGNTTMITNEYLRTPFSLGEWIPQLTIFGLNGPGEGWLSSRLLPPAWSLETELVYYLLIGLFVGTSCKRSLWWLLLASAVAWYGMVYESRFMSFYQTWHGPMLAFAAGSASYHARKRMMPRKPAPVWIGAMMVVGYACIGGYDMVPRSLLIGYHYLAIPLFVWVLMNVYAQEHRVRPSALDKWCGDVSYPVFLLHWPLVALVLHFISVSIDSWKAVLLGGPLTFACAALVRACVDVPLAPLRSKVRDAARAERVQPAHR